MTASAETSRRARLGYALAAAGCAAVTAVFATVGDGVDVPSATGVRRVVIDGGHQLVWALLAGAFTAAAIRGRWSRPAGALATAGAATYALFLFAVFLWN